MEVKEFVQMVDYAYLKADATEEDMKRICDDAKEYNFKMVAVNSCQTKRCKEYLKGTDIHVGAAIGFPLGQTTIATKVFETKDAIENGADEIDYVINITELKAKNYDYIKEEMESIVSECRKHNVIVKVILETCYLTKDEIKKMAEIAKEVRPDFVKTSTGFGSDGAKVEDVELIHSVVGDDVQIKASGGVRTLEDVLKLYEAGCTRFGTSSAIKIIEEIKNN